MFDFDMDRLTAFGAVVSAGLSRFMPAMSRLGGAKFERWRRGRKLKVLLVGYNGAGNTGADARVEAMARQLACVLGTERVEISVLTQAVDGFSLYFDPSVELIKIDPIFFRSVFDACGAHHMAVLSEGAALKSTFANALTLLFCEAAGIMKNQGKPCVAYGCEAGAMDPYIERIAGDLCRDTYFIARTAPSLGIVRGLGLEGHLGTDTAWTFPAGPEEWVAARLEEIGRAGGQPIIGACVTNPFWWPVKPSLTRLARAAVTRSWDDHYRKWYFFSYSEEGRRRMADYTRAVAAALDNFADRHKGLVVILGMDARDLDACKQLQLELKHPAEIFCAHQYDGYQLCSILRALDLVVTSDYHGSVLSMTGGVPSVAVSLDERLANLFEETGHKPDYFFEAADPILADRLDDAVRKMMENRASLSTELLGRTRQYLEKLGNMGMFLRGYVEEHFPGLPLPDPPETWRDALGPLDPAIAKILDD
ncbi:MAG: hypothetical protein ABIJ56_07320 [Pseudomonadota bacterium]